MLLQQLSWEFVGCPQRYEFKHSSWDAVTWSKFDLAVFSSCLLVQFICGPDRSVIQIMPLIARAIHMELCSEGAMSSLDKIVAWGCTKSTPRPNNIAVLSDTSPLKEPWIWKCLSISYTWWFVGSIIAIHFTGSYIIRRFHRMIQVVDVKFDEAERWRWGVTLP